MLLFFSIILVNQKKSFVDQILKSIRIPMRQSSRGLEWVQNNQSKSLILDCREP